MKARYFLIAMSLFFITTLSACYNSYHYRDDGNLSVTVSESDDEYKMYASFDEDKTRMVRNYISNYTDNGLFKGGGNIYIDANTTYGDNVNIYVKFKPGKLKIELDKNDNSEEAYREVKDMCEGIKDLLTKPEEEHQ